jgi:hypothetical protein
MTFIRRWDTNARPAAFMCDDGKVRVVKCRRNDQEMGRILISDHIVAHLGQALGAPTGEPRLVDVPAELVAAEPQIAHFVPSVGHGTLFVDGCTDRQWLSHMSVPENRPRFARLATLYGWAVASDHQLIYMNSPPHLVFSVDHGHFFPGSTNWNAAQLDAAPNATLDGNIVQGCQLTPDEIREAGNMLLAIRLLEIADAVASPLEAWGVTAAERFALLTFLVRRRAQLLPLLLA